MHVSHLPLLWEENTLNVPPFSTGETCGADSARPKLTSGAGSLV